MHLPTWADRRRDVRAGRGVAAARRALRLERLRLRPARSPRGSTATGRRTRRCGIASTTSRPTPDRPDARRRRARSRSTGRPQPSGKGCSTSPGSRPRRSTAGSTGGRSTSERRSSSGSRDARREPLRLDRRALRPVERERHRGRRLLRRGGRAGGRRRWSSWRSAPAGSRCPTAAAGIRVIGIDSSPGMLDVCRRRAELAGRRASCSTCGSASSRRRRSRSGSRSSPVRSARSCTCSTTTRACARSARRASCSLPGGRLVFDVFAPSAERHRRHARPLARARARHLRARRLGLAGADADAVGARRERRDELRARVALERRVARAPRAGRLPGRSAATAGSTAARTPAARTRSGSRGSAGLEQLDRVADGDLARLDDRARASRACPASSARRPSRSSSIRWHGSQTIVISKTASSPTRTRWPIGHCSTSVPSTVRFSRIAPGSTPTESRCSFETNSTSRFGGLACAQPSSPSPAIARRRSCGDRGAALAARRRPDTGDLRHPHHPIRGDGLTRVASPVVERDRPGHRDVQRLGGAGERDRRARGAGGDARRPAVPRAPTRARSATATGRARTAAARRARPAPPLPAARSRRAARGRSSRSRPAAPSARTGRRSPARARGRRRTRRRPARACRRCRGRRRARARARAAAASSPAAPARKTPITRGACPSVETSASSCEATCSRADGQLRRARRVDERELELPAAFERGRDQVLALGHEQPELVALAPRLELADELQLRVVARA